MVGVAQLVRAPDCGSGGRRFDSDHPPHIMGCSQAVRHGTLTPACVGSNPAIPAILKIKPLMRLFLFSFSRRCDCESKRNADLAHSGDAEGDAKVCAVPDPGRR